MGISIGRPLTQVQIIQRENDLVLVQWMGDDEIPRRSWVAQHRLLDEKGRSAEVDNPGSGIPYGVEFWRLVKMKATPRDLDRELKARGIWTADDARTRPNEVVGALIAAYGIDLAAVLRAVEQYEKDLAAEV